MHCQNLFCIYWDQNQCTLDGITLDIRGSCEDCIYITPEESYLKQKRDELLYRYELEDSTF